MSPFFFLQRMISLIYHRSERNAALVDVLSDTAAVSIHVAVDRQVAWSLLEQQSGMALASPLLFGKRAGDFVVLPGACVAVSGATNELLLYFRSGLRSIDTVGYFGEAGLETMLVQVLLKEKYGMEPSLHRITSQPEKALTQTDAVLIQTDAEQISDLPYPSLDLFDEWFDLTQLPFIRELFIAWEVMLTPSVVEAVRNAGARLDSASLHDLEHAIDNRDPAEYTSTLPPHYRYSFNDDSHEGLRTFFQLAFYHGLHRDIPDFREWEDNEEHE